MNGRTQPETEMEEMHKKELCCIFNYAPLYRTSIYSLIDSEYDAMFFFGDEPVEGRGSSGIAQMDRSIFRRTPGRIVNRVLFGRIPWRSGMLSLPFRFRTFLVSGDFNWAYFPFLALCRILGRKVYAWGHGFKELKRYACLKHLYLKWLDGYFVYGARTARRMEELGFDGTKLHVIYNSLGTGTDPESNRLLGGEIYHSRFGNRLPVIIFAGRLTAAKRLDMLVDAYIEHSIEGLRYNLVIVGDGPEMGMLRRKVENAPFASGVWLYGECYDEKRLSVLLYNATLCVSPGNVGLTAVHAMSYGTPVVSHNDFMTQMPEYETVVEGRTGLLYRAGDYADLKRAIRQWLTSGRSREEIRMDCYREIDARWNSLYQLDVLKSVISR